MTTLRLLDFYEQQKLLNEQIIQCEKDILLEIIEKNKLSLVNSDIFLTQNFQIIKYIVKYDQISNSNNVELIFSIDDYAFTLIKKISCIEIGFGGNFRCNLKFYVNGEIIYNDNTKNVHANLYKYEKRNDYLTSDNKEIIFCFIELLNTVNKFKLCHR